MGSLKTFDPLFFTPSLAKILQGQGLVDQARELADHLDRPRRRHLALRLEQTLLRHLLARLEPAATGIDTHPYRP
ncbi:MAG: hypothetical protein A2284_16610 [Deltaproteobacteria bacterium RIFOXYA12_FULL_61_11]|nr:MAG: hypothetical protein A2284_16610 [Deltaproteobacteria bacterium RIFOXYA12_FULL_61_11]